MLSGLFSEAIASCAYLRHSRRVHAHSPSRAATSASHPGHTQHEASHRGVGGGVRPPGGTNGEGERRAPRATRTEAQPEARRSSSAETESSASPLTVSRAWPARPAMTGASSAQRAASLGRSVAQRACIARAAAPAAIRPRQRSRVASGPSAHRRILHESSTPAGRKARSAATTLSARSRSAKSAAPLPPALEHSFGHQRSVGQPMFTSSCTMPSRVGSAGSKSLRAAARAPSGSAVPSCTTSRPRSASHVRKTIWPAGPRQSVVPSRASTERVDVAIFASTSSSE